MKTSHVLQGDERSDSDVSEIDDKSEERFAQSGENVQAYSYQEQAGDRTTNETPPSPQKQEPQIFAAGGQLELRSELRRPCRHCNSSVVGPQIQCMFCLDEANTNDVNTTTEAHKSAANRVSTQGHFSLNIQPGSYAASLPSLPDTSLEDGACASSLQQVESVITGHSQQVNTPVCGKLVLVM